MNQNIFSFFDEDLIFDSTTHKDDDSKLKTRFSQNSNQENLSMNNTTNYIYQDIILDIFIAKIFKISII